MALQTSGQISLGNLQTEYGGSNPINFSEYYKNGSYVPSTVSVPSTTRQPSSGTLYALYTTPRYYYGNQGYSFSFPEYNYRTYITWNNTAVVGLNDGVPITSSYTKSGWTYYRSTLVETDSENGSSYRIYRTQPTSTPVTVNSSVPTSGQIALSNFYGGSKTA